MNNVVYDLMNYDVDDLMKKFDMQLGLLFSNSTLWRFFGYREVPRKRTGLSSWMTSKDTEIMENFLKNEISHFGVGLLARSLANHFKNMNNKAFFELANQHYLDGWISSVSYLRPTTNEEIMKAKMCLSDYEYGSLNSDYLNFMKHAVMYGMKPQANSKFDMNAKAAIQFYQSKSDELAVGICNNRISIVILQ